MFNIKNFFSSKKVDKEKLTDRCDVGLSEAVIDALTSYQSDAFPVGLINACSINSLASTDDAIALSLSMHFAATSEQPAITEHLQKTLKRDVELKVSVQLLESYRHSTIKHIVLVASGKGGVGKSTCAVNLAYGLKQNGATVGVLDADIYGPSIPLLLGLNDAEPIAKNDTTLLPMEHNGLIAQSIGFLLPAGDATVWRGPMASNALMQLLNETAWPELDYLIVDMPPGTGDIQLTMSQKIPASGAVIITTPQDLALADATKGITMFDKVNVPILGIVENMSYFHCQQCDGINHIFGQGGGETLARNRDIPLLAQVPLSMAIREAGEAGEFISHITDKPLVDIYNRAAKSIASYLFFNGSGGNPVDIIITDD